MGAALLSTQMVRRAGFIEFAWGQPDPDLLPVEALQRAAAETLTQAGEQALAYGAPAGPGPLLDWLRARIQRVENIPLAEDEIATTGGNSEGLDQICTLHTRPGDRVLVEAPTYHLAVRILRDHALELSAVPTDEHGLRLDALKETLRQFRREGRPARLLYTIPTFHNPTGLSLSDERRREVVGIAAEDGLLIVEDDVYRELCYDGDAPPSLWSLAPRGTVLRLGSFSKALAPGLRLGFITGRADHVQRLPLSGLRDSGGGVNHFTAMVVNSVCRAGDFDRQVARLRAAYRARRAALLDALSEHMPAGCAWTRPAGGFFVWVTLPAQVDAAALLPQAEARGVTYLPSASFHLNGGGRNALRLAFSLHPPDELAEGVRRLAMTVREAPS